MATSVHKHKPIVDFITQHFKPSFRNIKNYLALFGASLIVRYAYKNIEQHIKENYGEPDSAYLASRYGIATAVVSEAANEIGASFAFELARLGFSLVLFSRTPERLADVRRALLDKYPRANVIVMADFSHEYLIANPDAATKRIRQELASHSVAVLVNTQDYYSQGVLGTQSPQQITDTINLNVWPTIVIGRAVVPLMLARAGKRSLIIDAVRANATLSHAHLPIYSGSHATLYALSRSLEVEYFKSIDVECLLLPPRTPANSSSPLTPPEDSLWKVYARHTRSVKRALINAGSTWLTRVRDNETQRVNEFVATKY